MGSLRLIVGGFAMADIDASDLAHWMGLLEVNLVTTLNLSNGDGTVRSTVLEATAQHSGGALVELFDGQNFQGRLGTLRGPTPNFEPLGMNDKVASLIVRRGTWEFCTDAFFKGTCRTVGPGRYGSLPREMDSKISSVRQVGR